ncbi:hypothetical protein A3K87_08320 [Variovorax paradoxus]|uniref:Uncharacterized protein n=1 Tax=Variovorax paradoxus TaxID=34073 RepID=A0AA91DTU7_VARPD|nr:hypothetical protein [Variovorax paradoxus]OAK66441.1 hypothetical protein A3K87_08320 [Variovorax paradoxus]
MASTAGLWPWLAVAGLGALHGLSPANGWMFAAACGVQARDGAQARRALLPIALGHCVSVAVVAWGFAWGMSMEHARVQGVAGGLLLGLAAYRCLRGEASQAGRGASGIRAGQAGIALWSFLMATAHGAGLMLVPALMPLCLADNPAREITASGSLLLALAAIGVHTAATLATTGAIAAGVCRGVALHPRLMGDRFQRHAWTAALAATGVLLVVLRGG